MKKKTYQLGVRMDEDLLARLRAFEKQTGISSSALARATLESALDYFEEEKEIVFPLCCVPRSKLESPPPRKQVVLFYDKKRHFVLVWRRFDFQLAANSLFYRFGDAFDICVRHATSGRKAKPPVENIFGNAVSVECV